MSGDASDGTEVAGGAARPVPATAGGPEVAWFSALCDDDYEYLGVADPELRSSWQHCRSIVAAAERAGYDNVLLPSGYSLGIDGVPFAGGIAAVTERIRLLLAVRCGEMWPPQLARQLAGLDEMLGGRLTINIISSVNDINVMCVVLDFHSPFNSNFCRFFCRKISWILTFSILFSCHLLNITPQSSISRVIFLSHES